MFQEDEIKDHGESDINCNLKMPFNSNQKFYQIKIFRILRQITK